MRYFVIAGEASGDLHAGRLMDAIRREDARAEIRYWYRPDLAYMGIVPVVMHLRAILRGMKDCRAAILEFRPDRLVLVDYPGFNLSIASWFKERFPADVQSESGLTPKVIYYIPPKVWAWKEGRVARIKRHVDRVLSILPFEEDWYASRHDYHVDYVGNPTLDEIAEFRRTLSKEEVEAWRQSLGLRDDTPVLALMPGSRRQEIERNLPMMLRAAGIVGGNVQYVIASAPGMTPEFYARVINRVVKRGDDDLRRRIILAPCRGSRSSFLLLYYARAALVTSGTATLEAAIMDVPQVVCYAMRCGLVVSALRSLVLKVPYVSLVNLIVDAEVVPELVAGDFTLGRLIQEMGNALYNDAYRARQCKWYDRMMLMLGQPGAPERAARLLMR